MLGGINLNLCCCLSQPPLLILIYHLSSPPNPPKYLSIFCRKENNFQLIWSQLKPARNTDAMLSPFPSWPGCRSPWEKLIPLAEVSFQWRHLTTATTTKAEPPDAMCWPLCCSLVLLHTNTSLTWLCVFTTCLKSREEAAWESKIWVSSRYIAPGERGCHPAHH